MKSSISGDLVFHLRGGYKVSPHFVDGTHPHEDVNIKMLFAGGKKKSYAILLLDLLIANQAFSILLSKFKRDKYYFLIKIITERRKFGWALSHFLEF